MDLDPDPKGQKTYGSYGSRSATLPETLYIPPALILAPLLPNTFFPQIRIPVSPLESPTGYQSFSLTQPPPLPLPIRIGKEIH
jgi:hypothetical protein